MPDGVSVFPLGQRHLRGIDEPERVFEVAIDGLEHEDVEAMLPESPTPAPGEPPAPPAPGGELESDVTRRFESLGARLAAEIQDSVLRSLEGKASRAGDGSAVDDIASRFGSMGAEIDARVRAALEKKGVSNPRERDG